MGGNWYEKSVPAHLYSEAADCINSLSRFNTALVACFCCFHKGRSFLAVTINYFCDFVCDLIFFWFNFRLRTIAGKLLHCIYCRFLINCHLRRLHHDDACLSCNFASCNLDGYDTIRYDTRCHFNVRSKANMSQLNLPHGTDN